MNGKQVTASVFGTVIKVSIAAIIIMFVYQVSTQAYDFGYRIFAEPAMSAAPGVTMTVTVTSGDSVSDIGKILEKEGLIKSAKLFYIQEKVSEYKGLIQPGIYELNTSMTADEMLEVMADVPEDGTKAEDTKTDISVSDNATGSQETGVGDGEALTDTGVSEAAE